MEREKEKEGLARTESYDISQSGEKTETTTTKDAERTTTKDAETNGSEDSLPTYAYVLIFISVFVVIVIIKKGQE
ncbi:Hypothetical predicted protein [Octopus vulgaris]|uniref:Uncharacterized protein n=1 Tax=Octopus vulgaris TaxID=6645 RepID=A0AA36FM09_OCTVU|nr:Hypothetical predicted protein [Octopus vulgaris]